MSQPVACIRCGGTELQPATLELAAPAMLVVDATHASPMTARVCLACGAVLLTATDVANLRVGETPLRQVQEYDF